jgi:ADP-heptose:LPS heptosyltransferase
MLLQSSGPWRKVAVLRPGRIGDYLCATPAVRALREALPGARLDYVALPLVRDLVLLNPSVDRFVAFPGFPYIAEQFFEPRRAVEWLAAMQDEEYDLVVQLYGSGVYANPIAQLMGGRCTAGFIRPGDHHSLDAAIPLPETGSEVDRVLSLVRHLGAPDAGRYYDLAVPASKSRRGIGVHCGARDAHRQADRAVFAAAGRSLGYGEIVDLDELARTAPLGDFAAVVASLDLLLTTDSGPAHIAYAVGTPSVTVFVASDPVRWGPPVPGPHLVLDCREETLTPEALLAAARQLVSRSG